MDLRACKSVVCVAVLIATGCAGGQATTIPDADRSGAASPTSEARPDDAERIALTPPPADLPDSPAALRDPSALPLPPTPPSNVTQPGAAGERVTQAPEEPVVPPDEPAPLPSEAPVYSADVCPVGIPGLAVRAAPARGGAELVLTADPMHRRALRERMARFAELHRENRRAHAGETTEQPATFGDEDAHIHHADVRVVPTDAGVRLIARADRPADIADLREELQEDADALGRGACPLALAIVS